jgi:YD repeat-containing protein
VVKNSSATITLNLNARGSYAYDAEGNLVWMQRDNKNYAFVWDALSRLSGVTVRDGAGHGLNWSAGYDALGRRVQTTTQTISNNVAVGSADVVRSLCDPLCHLAEILRVSASSTNFFLYGPDLSDAVAGAGGIGGLLATRQNGSVYQVLNDLRGNVVGWVDGGGTASWNPRYGVFLTKPANPAAVA